MTTRAAWLIVAGLAGCGTTGSAPGDADEAPANVEPTPVRCAAVVSQPAVDVVQLRGQLAPPPNARVSLGARTSGVVARLLVEPGQQVAAGALLAVVTDPALDADRAGASAAVKAAVAVEHQAELEQARQAKLADAGIGTPRERDAADAQVATAHADRLAAEARAMLAGRDLGRAAVRAPFAGTIVNVWRQAGELVDGSAGTPVVELADLRVLELHAVASAAAMARLAVGMHAAITLDGGAAPLDGTVVALSPTLDATTGLGRVRISVDGGGLRVGVGASAQLAGGPHPARVVPRAALRRSATGDVEVLVCGAAPATAVEARPVRTTTATIVGAPTMVEIVDGLALGERIVVDHALGLDAELPVVEAGAP